MEVARYGRCAGWQRRWQTVKVHATAAAAAAAELVIKVPSQSRAAAAKDIDGQSIARAFFIFEKKKSLTALYRE